MDFLTEKEKNIEDYIKEGNLQEAENLIKEILQMNANDLYAKGQLIKIYRKQRKFQEAEILAKEILKVEPNNIPTNAQLISVYMKQMKYKNAEILALKLMKLEPDNINRKEKLLKIYRKQEKFQLAEDLAKQMIKLQPDSEIRKSQLVKLYIEQGKLEEAEKMANEILKSKSDSSCDIIKHQLVKIYIEQRRFQDAENLTNEILSIQPTDVSLKTQLVDIYIEQGKLKEAENVAKELLESKSLQAQYITKQLSLIHIKQKKSQRNESQTYSKDLMEKSKEEVNTSKNIKKFRKRIYNQEISLENIKDFEEEISIFSEFEQKMLLAELYTHLNLVGKAKQALKDATNIKEISEEQQKILKQAIQIIQSNKMNVIQRNKKWGLLTGTYEEYQR